MGSSFLCAFAQISQHICLPSVDVGPPEFEAGWKDGERSFIYTDELLQSFSSYWRRKRSKKSIFGGRRVRGRWESFLDPVLDLRDVREPGTEVFRVV